MFKKISLLMLVSLASCTTPLQRQIAQSPPSRSLSCQPNSRWPRLFNILQNNSDKIVVELGPFADFFEMDNDFSYQVYFKGSKENKADQETLILSGQGQEGKTIVTVPVTATGVYIFKIYEEEGHYLWVQKVFGVAPKESTLSVIQRNELAEKYAPIVEYHKDEKYFPASLSYLFNEEDTDARLAQEPFVLKAKAQQKSWLSFMSSPTLNVDFQLSEIRQILPYYGHSESVLKSGLDDSTQTLLRSRYGKNHAQIYYSVFENAKWNEIYINYHMFYAFDPKNGTDQKLSIAEHIFDRESITVVLRKSTLKPLSVFYGAHLANQTMAYLDSNDQVKQQWQTGRVFVNWPEVKKVGERPLAVAALGSHGMYPVAGNYAVMMGKIKVLREPAGGGYQLYPQFEKLSVPANGYSYKLAELNLKNVTSSCESEDNILAFSGSTVDVLGPTNATFPPFTDREEDYFSYADPNAPMFEMPR